MIGSMNLTYIAGFDTCTTQDKTLTIFTSFVAIACFGLMIYRTNKFARARDKSNKYKYVLGNMLLYLVVIPILTIIIAGLWYVLQPWCSW